MSFQRRVRDRTPGGLIEKWVAAFVADCYPRGYAPGGIGKKSSFQRRMPRFFNRICDVCRRPGHRWGDALRESGARGNALVFGLAMVNSVC
jgi:hypothetical protein